MDKLAKIESKTEIVKKYSVLNSLELFENVNTSIQAFNAPCESLASIRKEHGKEMSLNLIKIWMISLNDFVNSARKMNPAQIEEISHYIYQDYYYLKMSDLYLIITRIKKGHYGKLYENLDGMKILSFFNEYANERANLIEQQSLIDHDKLKYLEEKNRK